MAVFGANIVPTGWPETNMPDMFCLHARRSQPVQAKIESTKADFVNFVAAISIA